MLPSRGRPHQYVCRPFVAGLGPLSEFSLLGSASGEASSAACIPSRLLGGKEGGAGLNYQSVLCTVHCGVDAAPVGRSGIVNGGKLAGCSRQGVSTALFHQGDGGQGKSCCVYTVVYVFADHRGLLAAVDGIGHPHIAYASAVTVHSDRVKGALACLIAFQGKFMVIEGLGGEGGAEGGNDCVFGAVPDFFALIPLLFFFYRVRLGRCRIILLGILCGRFPLS